MKLGPFDIQAPVLLLGLLGAAIPVLLHLLSKVRAPQVFFPTLRFLRLSMDKTARRRRVQHWLLLLLRMAALAALAIAVAQPVYQATHARAVTVETDRDTAIVVILDNSLSMQFGPRGETSFDLARQQALVLLDRKFPEAALIVTNGPPLKGPISPGNSAGGQANRPRATELVTSSRLVDLVRGVQPSSGLAELDTAVRQARDLLAASRAPNKEIYLFTDLQACSIAPVYALADEIKRENGPSVFVIAPKRPDKPAQESKQSSDSPPVASPIRNVAVTRIELGQPQVSAGKPAEFRVTVQNFGSAAVNAAVTPHQDDQARSDLAEQSGRVAALAPGASAVKKFTLVFAEPGVHYGKFEVKADGVEKDDLPGDDARFFAVDVADRINVMLIKPRHELDKNADAGFWISRMISAVDPDEGGQPFNFTERTADDMPNASDLRDKQVLITSDLADLAALAPPAGGEVQPDADPLAGYRRFVRDGGTWMIFLGPTVADLAGYNRLLTQPGPDGDRPMLDGRLVGYVGSATGGRESAREDLQTTSIDWVDLSHPMFKDFYPGATIAPFKRVQVYRRAIVDIPDGSTSRAIATVTRSDPSDGTRFPLVIETRPYDRGRVLLFATAANAQWTNWLRRPAALVIRQMMVESANRSRSALIEHAQGSQVVVDLPSWLRPVAGSPSMATAIVKSMPNGATTQADVEPVGRFGLVARFRAQDSPGAYTWQAMDAAGKIVREGGFAVNVPPRESDLETMDLPEGGGDDGVIAVRRSVAEIASLTADRRKRENLWPYLLAAVLVLLAVEAKIANRSRPTTEGGLRFVLPAPAKTPPI